MRKERYVCIHAHFYQPPRENPWLEAIELQDSAYPYHDWNEKITAQCYATNATSRILDDRGRITRIINNYSRISFNFGPTLLSWLEHKALDVYGAILEADRESLLRCSGHGAAIAQAYNHMILPLANLEDKRTQVRWGLHDFEHRFQRKPEGMWLPETAVDLETLEVLAEEGILFTLLAPHQARRVRPLKGGEWREVDHARIDPRHAYRIRLPSGKTMALFFYDGPISRAVAFEKLLTSGEDFARRILGGLSEEMNGPQLAHIATDGETYGHHHIFGDMALAYALEKFETGKPARLTNYGEFLERHPPEMEVEIFEDTSWSCAHGIERWRSDCGCRSGMHPEWNQAWRAPLRAALDWLRDQLAEIFEEEGRSLLKEPWSARNHYIEVILDRTEASIRRFLERHAAGPLDGERTTAALKLLEMQRHAMLMYTSCGWFFDELSGIETVQIIQYAGRTLQLGEEVFGKALDTRFLELLGEAPSNIPEHENGRVVYDRFVRPAMVDLKKVGAHYAMTSLFEEYEDEADIYCYKASKEDFRTSESGRAKLLVGRARFVSTITMEEARLSFGVLHLGDHNINCGVRAFQGDTAYKTYGEEIFTAFSRADFPATIRFLDKHFGAATYSLQSLFRDEQRRITDLILESTLEDTEAIYRQLYENHAPLLRFLKDARVPLPKALSVAAELVYNTGLRRAFEADELDPDAIKPLLQEALAEGIAFDEAILEYTLRKSLERMAQRIAAAPSDLAPLERLVKAMDLLAMLPFQVNLWRVQNTYYEILEDTYPHMRRKAQQGDREAIEWIDLFFPLGERLTVRVV